MNNEDRKYLRYAQRLRPSLEVFGKMAKILTVELEQINRLLVVADTSLLKTFKTIGN